MPNRKPKRRVPKKTRARGRATPKYKSGRTMQVGRSPFAKSQVVRLRYCELVSINPPGVAASSYIFSANGVYDPNITGTGHQPIGFDEWMLRYNHFTVLGSKMTARFTGQSAAVTDQIFVAVLLKASPTIDTNNFETLVEQNGGKYKFVSGITGANASKVCVSKFSPKKFFSISNPDQSQYRGDAANNPNEQAYYHLIAASTNFQDPVSMAITVVIDYMVLFTEPKPLSGS